MIQAAALDLFHFDQNKEKLTPIVSLYSIPGGRLIIKMSPYQYRDPHVKDKIILWAFYLLYGIPVPGKAVLILELYGCSWSLTSFFTLFTTKTDFFNSLRPSGTYIHQ